MHFEYDSQPFSIWRTNGKTYLISGIIIIIFECLLLTAACLTPSRSEHFKSQTYADNGIKRQRRLEGTERERDMKLKLVENAYHNNIID